MRKLESHSFAIKTGAFNSLKCSNFEILLMYKVRPSKFAPIQAFLLVGLGYSGVDYLSAWIHREYYTRKKFSSLNGVQGGNQIELPLDNHFLRNLFYGILAANTAKFVHFKTNQFLLQTNRPPQTKLVRLRLNRF